MLAKIEQFLLDVVETKEYKDVEYLIFSIRKLYLDYLAFSRISKFDIPKYLEPLIDVVVNRFNKSGISTVDMLQYMLDNDVNDWVKYYAQVFIYPVAKGENIEAVESLDDIYILVLTGYILDSFREKVIDIEKIVAEEKFLYDVNQYGLSIVNDVEFKKDYFVFDGKAYLYSILTNVSTIEFYDTMPAFAKIITDCVTNGNILLRLDERLALPAEQAISYSQVNFDKYRGPQFHFNESVLQNTKNITIHIDDEGRDKLLMVVKKKYDESIGKKYWDVEIETLPYCENDSSKKKRIITTFLHGIYYPDNDIFTHIDCARNQYVWSDYVKKYTESSQDVPVDLHTKNKQLHYKIWCVEKGEYSREIWYKLMISSLSEKYRILLDEILS